jgi:hypothetical protein
MKIKSPIGFLALWSAFLAVGTWMLPVGALLSFPRQVQAVVAEQPGGAVDDLALTGEYVLSRSEAITQQDMLRAHREAFRVLFGADWDPEQWAYPLTEGVTGVGRYVGRNQLGVEYTLSVVQWTPTSLEEVPLTMDQRQLAKEIGFTLASVTAIISTPSARVHMHGLVVSKRLSGSERSWAFLPTYFADPGHPFFSGVTVNPYQGAVPSDEGFLEDVRPSGVSSDGSECIDAAISRYHAAVSACNDAHNAVVHQCNQTHAISVATCNIAYGTTVAGATDAYHDCLELATVLQVVCLVLCLGGTAGWGSFFCVAACLIPTVAAQAVCARDYAAAVGAATTVRNACIGAATVARTNCVVVATLARDACIDAALTKCMDEVAECSPPSP